MMLLKVLKQKDCKIKYTPFQAISLEEYEQL